MNHPPPQRAVMPEGRSRLVAVQDLDVGDLIADANDRLWRVVMPPEVVATGYPMANGEQLHRRTVYALTTMLDGATTPQPAMAERWSRIDYVDHGQHLRWVGFVMGTAAESTGAPIVEGVQA